MPKKKETPPKLYSFKEAIESGKPFRRYKFFRENQGDDYWNIAVTAKKGGEIHIKGLGSNGKGNWTVAIDDALAEDFELREENN